MKLIGESTPAWTMTGDKEIPGPKLLTPGPGAHQISTGERATWIAAPKWGFGKGKRADWSTGTRDFPGPGTYYKPDKKDEDDKQDDKKGKKHRYGGIKDAYDKDRRDHFFTYAKRNENATAKMNFPGPGSYQHKLVSKAPAKYSFGYKVDTLVALSDNDLGPGQYKPKYSQQEFWKANLFGNEAKGKQYNTMLSCSPSPAKYFPTECPPRSSTKGTFGRATRDDLYKSNANMPGPASYRYKNYTLKDSVDKGKGYSISGKYTNGTQQTSNNTPGPGEYNPSTTKTKKAAPRYRFGTGDRPDLNVDYTKAPGPGTYYRDEDMENADYFKKLKGPMIMQDTFIPHSPKENLDYEKEKNQEWIGYLSHIGEFNVAAKYSFSGKRDTASKRGEYKTPGPGAYDPFYYDPDMEQRMEGRTPIIGTSVRPPVGNMKDFVPGPGHYNPKANKFQAGSKFGRARKHKEVEEDDPDIMPGPGKYDIQHTIPQIQYWDQNMMSQRGLKIALNLKP